MASVNLFGIPADQPERAIGFYENVFGWQFDVWWEYDAPNGRERTWRINGAGLNGVLTRREFPGQPIGIGVEVESVLEFIARVERFGGKVIVGKTALPKFGWFAMCQDSEGNSFAISQRDPSVE